MEKSEKLKERYEKAHAEYSQMCAQAGNLHYHIGVMQEDLKQMNVRMKALNNTAHGLKKQLKKNKEGTEGNNENQESVPSGVSIPTPSNNSVGSASGENTQLS